MNKAAPDGVETLNRLYQVIESRKGGDPKESRTARLFAAGVPKIAQKVGEEATEVVVASLAQGDEALVAESADLIYHLLVLLSARGIKPEAVYAELAGRAQG